MKIGFGAALALILLAAGGAHARTLHWRSFEVDARLDGEGSLRVLERQLMVFSGAWNGGEREFRVERGQKLVLHGMRRLDPASDRAVAMRRGSLGRVDNYDWSSRHTLRWRSRDPSDPEFDRTELLYELDYTLTGVVNERDGNYWLAHDFAFADRVGVIESFRLELEIDDAWSALEIAGAESGGVGRPNSFTVVRSDLEPGTSVVLDVGLRRLAPAPPASVRGQMSTSSRVGAVGLLLGGIALLVGRFVAHERKQGRYRSIEVPVSPDPTWLRSRLLSMRPEVVGALWDHRIGAPEVAATLGRLVSEGRLSSSVRIEGRWLKKKILELELQCDRDQLADYERRLIDQLFFGGRRTTDSAAVRKRYRVSGFSPAASISSGINKQVRKLPGFSSRLAKPSPAISMLLALAGLASLGLEAALRGPATAALVGITIALFALPTLSFGHGFARWYRRRAAQLWIPAIGCLVPVAVAIVIQSGAILTGRLGLFELGNFGLFGALAVGLLTLAQLNSILNAARTRDRKGAVALRRLLAEIRRLFARELRRPEPRLDDSWIPYLLALGLGRRVDRWFRAFGGARSGAARMQAGRGGSAWSGAGGSSWTGGGGSFGGAGAAGSWTAAAGALAAGVARPSSSGGGGSSSGSSGGSSSGGGGGGGW